MPKPIQLMTHLIPARYFVALLKGIYLKGIGLDILGAEAVLIATFGLSMVVMAKVAVSLSTDPK